MCGNKHIPIYGVKWGIYGESKRLYKFPEDNKEIQALKVKSTVKRNKILCSFYNPVFCKAGPGVCLTILIWTHKRRNSVATENITNNKEKIVNTVTIKADRLEEWNACFLERKKIH